MQYQCIGDLQQSRKKKFLDLLDPSSKNHYSRSSACKTKKKTENDSLYELLFK